MDAIIHRVAARYKDAAKPTGTAITAIVAKLTAAERLLYEASRLMKNSTLSSMAYEATNGAADIRSLIGRIQL
jgi:hypothetical protein